MRRTVVAVFALSLVVTASPASAGAGAVIVADDLFYSPEVTTASLNLTVGFLGTVQNAGAVAHTATANGGMFDTGQIPSGDTGQLQLKGAGTYRFHCTNHAEMKGSIGLLPVLGDPTPAVGDRVPLHLGIDGQDVWFDVRMRVGSKAWVKLADDRITPKIAIRFRTSKTYRFRVRTQEAVLFGPTSGWSPILSVKPEA